MDGSEGVFPAAVQTSVRIQGQTLTGCAPGIAELPFTSALSLENAKNHCSDECRSYHAIWGFLRLFGDLPAVTHDHDFLMSSLDAAITSGKSRVLVSGTADHGLLAYVIAAFEKARRKPNITVVDMCRTPLDTCIAYAALHNIQIKTVASDILSFNDAPYDIIVAHNFLNFFAPDDRQRLVSHWYNLLKPGGQVISFSTIKTGAAAASRRFERKDAEKLFRKMNDARRNSKHSDLISGQLLEEILLDFAKRRVSRNITSEDALLDPFKKAGFDVDVRLSAEMQGELWTSHRKKIRTGLVAHKSPLASVE